MKTTPMQTLRDLKNSTLEYLAFFTCGQLSQKHIVHNLKRFSKRYGGLMVAFLGFKKNWKTKKT